MTARIFLSRRSVLSRRSAAEEDGGGGRSMKITEDVGKYAAKQGIKENEALESGLKEKAKEFIEKGAEVYANG